MTLYHVIGYVRLRSSAKAGNAQQCQAEQAK